MTDDPEDLKRLKSLYGRVEIDPPTLREMRAMYGKEPGVTAAEAFREYQRQPEINRKRGRHTLH